MPSPDEDTGFATLESDDPYPELAPTPAYTGLFLFLQKYDLAGNPIRPDPSSPCKVYLGTPSSEPSVEAVWNPITIRTPPPILPQTTVRRILRESRVIRSRRILSVRRYRDEGSGEEYDWGIILRQRDAED